MAKITFDYKKALGFINENEINYLENQINSARDMLQGKTGPGNDYTGWVELPNDYDREEFGRIIKAAQRIRENSDVLIVIGIGGSYLGARAAIEALSHSFYTMLPKNKRNGPEIYFAGNNISPG
ncbi:MAG: glucose-6-phosphate isomerase, partial [Clostridiaceae bacterium]|nr:glucose-6-phosphate isomerase [Clostridiaceae bacterium]